MHPGTNTINYSIVWIAPKKDVAFLTCTNEGSTDAGLACDAAVTELIRLHFKSLAAETPEAK